jgi:hypothetical protein
VTSFDVDVMQHRDNDWRVGIAMGANGYPLTLTLTLTQISREREKIFKNQIYHETP